MSDPVRMEDSVYNLPKSYVSLIHLVDQSDAHCTHCGKCRERCELLSKPGWTYHDICDEARALVEDLRDVCAGEDEQSYTPGDERGCVGLPASEQVAVWMRHDALYEFSRTCFACNRCTCVCPHGISMTELWECLRACLREADILDAANTQFVKVDTTWDCFSVYRAVSGISYEGLDQLLVKPTDADEAGWTPPLSALVYDPKHAELVELAGQPRYTSGNEVQGSSSVPTGSVSSSVRSVLFVGCTLASYGDALVRKMAQWMNDEISPTYLMTQCCSSPLVNAGEIKRAQAWRREIIRAMVAAGVSQVVTICPGCEQILAAAAHEEGVSLTFRSFASLLREHSLALSGTVEDFPSRWLHLGSCHDRTGVHARDVEASMSALGFDLISCVDCAGCNATCCGAGGGVSSFDPARTEAHTLEKLRGAAQAGADEVMVTCPTCAYTYEGARRALPGEHLPHAHTYVELAFQEPIDWESVFAQLEGMWSGEYADWVRYQLIYDPHRG